VIPAKLAPKERPCAVAAMGRQSKKQDTNAHSADRHLKIVATLNLFEKFLSKII
jgi:hypothetical protein